MPIEIKLLTEDPIILATFKGGITIEDALNLFQFTAEIEQKYEGTIYRIQDFRESEVDFPTIMGILKESKKNMQQGSGMDERVQMIFLGGNAITDFARDVVSKQANRITPVFSDLDAALEAINVGMLGKPLSSTNT